MFYLDPSQLEGCTDPETKRLYDLWKKSQAVERMVWQVETQTLEQCGSVSTRWEVRRAKRERERGREIMAMLRLKLAKKGVRVGGTVDANNKYMEVHVLPVRKKTSVIGNMEQLVTRMLLRRNDSSQSIINRKPLQYQTKLPLS